MRVKLKVKKRNKRHKNKKEETSGNNLSKCQPIMV